MKYDIIRELKAKGAIESLSFDEQDALRRIIDGINQGPNSVGFDKESSSALINDGKNETFLAIFKNGREIRRGSSTKEKVKMEVLIELIPAGLCNFTVTKFDETGFRIMRFKTSIKPSHVFNQLEIKYYDSEATSCCARNKLGEPEERLFDLAGIIPDEEELVQFPDGKKGQDEIIEYMNIALKNPNSSYDEVAKSLAERKRIGSSDKEDMVIYLDENNNISINRDNNILRKQFNL